RGRCRLRRPRRDQGAGARGAARRATRPADRGRRRPRARSRRRRAAADARTRGRRRHREARGGLPVVTITWQNLADGVGLGAIYALMAVGIGLVFGVLRLVNFAYGQLVMAGAFALALASQWGWPLWAGIVLCFAVVLALSVAMDHLVFRPLRGHSPAVMLVATFAVAFLLQSIALLWFGSLAKIATSLSFLNQPWTISGVDIRKIAIVAVVVAAVCLALLQLLLQRTDIGLHMRAASMDFATSRMLGVHANRVISFAVLLSGALAAVVAVMLTVQ